MLFQKHRVFRVLVVSLIVVGLLGLTFRPVIAQRNNTSSAMSLSPVEQYPLWSYQTEGYVTEVSLSSDGSYLVVGSADRRIYPRQGGKVYLFSSLDNTPLWSYQTAIPPTVSISSNGSHLAAGDYSANLFSSSDNIPLWSYYGGGRVTVSISDNSRLAAGSIWGGIWFFSASDNIPLWSREMGYGFSVSSISMSSNASYLAVGCTINPAASDSVGDGHGVYLFSGSNNIPLWRYTTYVVSVSISSNGSYIAAVSDNGKAYIFSNSDNAPLWICEGISSALISSDGNYLAAVGDGKLCLFPRSDNVPLWSYQSEGQISSISISSDGDYIAAGSDDNRVYLFSRTDNMPLWSYQSEGRINSISISSDGDYIAAGSIDNKVYLFSRQVSTTPPTLGTPITYMAISMIVILIVLGSVFMLKRKQ